jgi:hypothetical protein
MQQMPTRRTDMAERSSDDLNETAPSHEGDKNPPSMAPEPERNEERGQDREQIEEDQEVDDRFQATDN